MDYDLTLVADTHCDTLGFVEAGKSSIINDYNASKKHPHLQVFAMYCAEDGETAKESFDRACRYIDIYKNAASEGKIKHCTTLAEIVSAIRENTRYISMLSIEGGECLMGSIENVYRFYEDGVRMIAPVWNHNNVWAAGSLSTGTPEDAGLSEKGVELIELCEKLGIIIDVSHSSDNTIRDIFAITKRPPCASHSNFREVCNHNRNLTKEHAEEISKRGGYIGLNLYHKFVRESDVCDNHSYSIKNLLSHIYYAKQTGLEGNIGFGFDIDGTGGLYPDEVDLKQSIHDLFIEEYISNESDHTFIDNISGKNFMNFLERYSLL
ncbi:MAG: hypothetical protein E7384_06035 [Ruminococcaceae bacterium]|nr:hypothetical protein [Oscillospiraceae bacterium]